MKVVLIDWNSYGNKQIEKVFAKRGTQVLLFPFQVHARGDEMEAQKVVLSTVLKQNAPNYVFSFNYFPGISEVCNEEGIHYVSWVYDSPFFDIYHYSVLNPINHIFMFDYGVAKRFEDSKIPTVHYLPLAYGGTFLDQSTGAQEGGIRDRNQNSSRNSTASKYSADVALVGSLYTEPKHRLYDKFAGVSPYAKGYLDSIIEAQKHIYGENIIERLLTPAIVEEMEKCYPTDPNPQVALSPERIYAEFVLDRQVTALERREILELLGRELAGQNTDLSFSGTGSDLQRSGYSLKLYTGDTSVRISGWKNMGPVDYYREMPEVFANTRINLNISLRSIFTGIPLRVFDIMGAGGFCLSNYQSELLEYFVPDEDFVFYNDYTDLLEKVEYYLSHEKERQEIARNGQEKVLRDHSMSGRLDIMEEVLQG